MNKVGTIRFEINLDLKNTESYEISLLDLMKQTETNVNITNKDEVEEMNNYAKQLEKKYGPIAVVKGKKIRVNDFLIQGTGYDADDPFIDDSGTEEAVVVAPDLMTQYGGFFINKDTLKINESSFVIERVEGENNSVISSKQPFQHKNNKMTKSQQLLSQARKRLNISVKNITKKHSTTTPIHKLDEIINHVVGIKNNKDITNKIDQEPMKNNKKVELTEAQIINKSPEKDQSIINIANQTNQPVQKPVSLPDGLPESITEKIKILIEMQSKCKTEGNKISNQFAVMLMEIDMLLVSKNIVKTTRSQVLKYIGYVTDIKYDSILRKIYKFKENKKKEAQNSLLKCLQNAINEAMPDSSAKFESDMKMYWARVEAQKLQSTSLQDNQSINIDLTNTSQDMETKTVKPSNKISQPKRYFKWTVACKSLLFKLINEELEALRIGKSKTTPEDHLTKFFSSSVAMLWPPKWMTTLQLLKVSSAAIVEFKACVANGKEFKYDIPIVKQKTIQKVKPVQNGATTKPKDVQTVNMLKQIEHKVKQPMETAPIVVKEQPLSPLKTLISPTKICDKGNITYPQQVYTSHLQLKANLDNNHVNDNKAGLVEQHKAKSHLIANHINPTKTRRPSPVQMLTKVHQPLRVSQPFVSLSELPTVSKEAVKRQSVEIQQGPSVKSVLYNHQEKMHNVPMIHRPNNEESLQYLYNPIYTNHNAVSHSPIASSAEQQLRISLHSNSSNNHFAHSNPFPHMVNNVSPENILKIPNRQSTIQSISSMLSPPIETRQNIPQHLPVNKVTLLSNAHSLQQQQQAQSIQRHYMGLQSEYDSPHKALFHQHTNPQTIDLIESPISMNTSQLSPDMYYNFNTAHYQNQRHYPN